MHNGGEFINICLLSSHVVNAELRVGHTPAEAGLGVWLVLAVAVAASWPAPHFYYKGKGKERKKGKKQKTGVFLWKGEKTDRCGVLRCIGTQGRQSGCFEAKATATCFFLVLSAPNRSKSAAQFSSLPYAVLNGSRCRTRRCSPPAAVAPAATGVVRGLGFLTRESPNSPIIYKKCVTTLDK